MENSLELYDNLLDFVNKNLNKKEKKKFSKLTGINLKNNFRRFEKIKNNCKYYNCDASIFKDKYFIITNINEFLKFMSSHYCCYFSDSEYESPLCESCNKYYLKYKN